MTPEQVKLVQDSFAEVEPIAGKAADLFYGRLFEIAPDVRPMFPDDLSKQKEKLMDMLGTAVNNLHQFEKIAPAVEDLGRKHVGYGVTSDHYEHVGSALLWTLEKGLGDGFTPPLKEAWTETYGALSGVMQKAATDMPPPVEKKGFFARMFNT